MDHEVTPSSATDQLMHRCAAVTAFCILLSQNPGNAELIDALKLALGKVIDAVHEHARATQDATQIQMSNTVGQA